MKYLAKIDIMPHRAILDPQGKAVNGGLKSMGISEIETVRIGKHIEIEMDAASEEEAKKNIEQACQKLLANPIMEFYHFSIHPLN